MRLGCLAVQPQGFTHLCLPTTGITSTHRHNWVILCEFWGFTSGLMLTMQQTLSQVSHHHSLWMKLNASVSDVTNHDPGDGHHNSS